MIFKRDPVQLNFSASSVLIVFRYHSYVNIHNMGRKRDIRYLHFHVLVEFLKGFLIIYVGPGFNQEFTYVGQFDESGVFFPVPFWQIQLEVCHGRFDKVLRRVSVDIARVFIIGYADFSLFPRIIKIRIKLICIKGCVV